MQSDADIVPTSFLEHIKSIYPSTPVGSISEIVGCPWYLVAAVAFVSCNRPGAVPSVFLHALDELKQAQETAGADTATAAEERKRLARRFRDSLVKACLLCGAPRAINGMIALHEVMPEELRDEEFASSTGDSTAASEEFDHTEGAVFKSMYTSKTTEDIQGLFNAIYPAFGWVSRVNQCGVFFGRTDELSPLETSYVMIAAIYGVETPRQFGWHLSDAQRTGATIEQVRAVRRICMEVGVHAGTTWKGPVPDVQ